MFKAVFYELKNFFTFCVHPLYLYRWQTLWDLSTLEGKLYQTQHQYPPRQQLQKNNVTVFDADCFNIRTRKESCPVVRDKYR